MAEAARLGPSRLTDPITLNHPDQIRPLLAQLVPVNPTLAGEPAILVLLADPTVGGGSDPTAALQLLGLTPAEAKVATLVGRGQSAREASAALSITENTARSTLKVVYQKLAIGKQTELARVITRLEAFGAALDPTFRSG